MNKYLSNAALDRRSALAALGAAGIEFWVDRRMEGEGLISMAANRLGRGAENEPLAPFRKKTKEILQRRLSDPAFTGQLPATEVQALSDGEGKPVPSLMADLLPLAQTYARPPISNYRVGAVARGASGALYFGANIEFPGQALGFAVHAEQSALSNAYMHDEHGASAIAVTAAPCGHCRQFMTELSPEGSIEVIIPGKAPVKLSTLLPMAFGPKELGLDHGALPVKETGLALAGGVSDELIQTALAAARRSWAPYSKSPSGVGLQTKRGRVFRGSYIENVAFNPSLPPFETALAGLILGGDDGAAIVRAVLVEIEGAAISQRRVSEAALSAIAPGVTLQVVKARKPD